MNVYEVGILYHNKREMKDEEKEFVILRTVVEKYQVKAFNRKDALNKIDTCFGPSEIRVVRETARPLYKKT